MAGLSRAVASLAYPQHAQGGAVRTQVGETFFLFSAAMHVAQGDPPDVAVSAASGATVGLATVVPLLAASFARLARLARSPLPVLLVGETGTGKEVLARAYHRLSNRSGPLIAVNCAALPPALLESNPFGHLRGAFTGANEDRRGLIASADGGTLFLDEVAELPLASQAALPSLRPGYRRLSRGSPPGCEGVLAVRMMPARVRGSRASATCATQRHLLVITSGRQSRDLGSPLRRPMGRPI